MGNALMVKNLKDETQARITAIVNVLEANRGEWVSTTDIGRKIGADRAVIKYVMPSIKAKYPEIAVNRHLGYMLPKKENDIPAPVYSGFRYKTPAKSKEGLAVMVEPTPIAKKPTAFLNGSKFRRGEIWKTAGSNGLTELFIVFNYVDGKVIGVPLFEEAEKDAAYVTAVNARGKRYFADCRMIKAKPERYFEQSVNRITPELYTEIQDTTRLMCGFKKTIEVVKEVPVEVVKEVEKRVEVPVEVVKEVPVEKPVDNLELSLLRQKVEIYEKLLDRLLAK